MHSTRNHRDFNHFFNTVANTVGVQYSSQWDLGVQTGSEYLKHNYHNVGKVYANEVLSRDPELSLHQKASLQHLMRTTSQHDFDNAMQHCMHYDAIKTPVSLFLLKTHEASEPDDVYPAHAEMSAMSAIPHVSETPISAPIHDADMMDSQPDHTMAVDSVSADVSQGPVERTLSLNDKPDPLTLSNTAKRRRKK